MRRLAGAAACTTAMLAVALLAPGISQATQPTGQAAVNVDATIKAPSPKVEQFFGRSVDVDGDMLAVGSQEHNNSGAVYVYRRLDPGGWVLEWHPHRNQSGRGRRVRRVRRATR